VSAQEKAAGGHRAASKYITHADHKSAVASSQAPQDAVADATKRAVASAEPLEGSTAQPATANATAGDLGAGCASSHKDHKRCLLASAGTIQALEYADAK